MDKKHLKKILEEKSKVKINLKNGFFYTGHIISVDDSSLLFKDKFGEEIPIDIDSISYVIPVRGEVRI